MDEKTYPFIEHLSELRLYLIKASYGFILGVSICFWQVDSLLHWLQTPILKALQNKGQLVVLTPYEYFTTQMKVACIFGIFLSSPWMFYQIWRFIAPGLYQQEKRFVFLLVTLSSFLFILGALFAYYFVFPPMFGFFVGTLPAEVSGSYSVALVLGFSLNMIFAFGLVFQVPVVIFGLLKAGILDIETLQKGRRYFIVLAFILAAILTPTPDPLTQTLMALPMIVLYEIGIWFSLYTRQKG